ncbi:hypothetical protein [Candidatus Electrothrix sp.]|uniref:hypothetical protein n=1 Tax=Candidatus Electrothrix sp. TaxID=2170559 RepID=UPI00405629C8
MLTIRPEYVIDSKKQPKAVLLPFSDWEKVLAELEELDDIRAYDQAKTGSQKSVPFDQAVREIQAEYDA